MTPPVVRTIREQIVNRLRSEMLSGQLSEGQPLREVQLAARFGVSRGPVRDALLQLTQEGLVVSHPHCGAKVGRVPSEAIRPLVIHLRREIEKFALDLVFDTLTADDLAEVQAILDRFHAACAAGDQHALIEHDMAFHRWIVQRTGEPDLVSIWLPILVRMRLVYSRHTDLEESYREHVAILDAIRRGDRQAALEALENNIQ